MTTRPRCDRASEAGCTAWPVWKMREPGDRSERNWIYACGRHLHTVASECTYQAGDRLDVVRVLGEEG